MSPLTSTLDANTNSRLTTCSIDYRRLLAKLNNADCLFAKLLKPCACNDGILKCIDCISACIWTTVLHENDAMSLFLFVRWNGRAGEFYKMRMTFVVIRFHGARSSQVSFFLFKDLRSRREVAVWRSFVCVGKLLILFNCNIYFHDLLAKFLSLESIKRALHISSVERSPQNTACRRHFARFPNHKRWSSKPWQ